MSILTLLDKICSAIIAGFTDIVQTIWDNLEELCGAAAGVFSLYFWNWLESPAACWIAKIITGMIAAYLGGYMAHLGKKHASKHIKAALFASLVLFASSCNFTYRINKNCKVYTQTDVAAQSQRLCLECTHELTDVLIKRLERAKR